MPVAVVTDSTAYLPAELADRHRLTVVPLIVVLDGTPGREGIDVGPADAAQALGARRFAMSTSRPAPEEFVETYRRLLAEGPTASSRYTSPPNSPARWRRPGWPQPRRVPGSAWSMPGRPGWVSVSRRSPPPRPPPGVRA
ncbi:hypothetical protein GCM10027615_77850 [Plantactinospora veratri]